MFRKLISNLSFSPALITQVSFYAQRLRREETTRRLSVIFVVLAILVQSLAVFSPPDSANASSDQDLLRGGFKDLTDLLDRYDKNSGDIKDIYDTLGVTRDEIVRSLPGEFNSKDSIYTVSRVSQYGPDKGETSFSYDRSTGGSATRYISPLSLADTSDAKKRNGTTYSALIGTSAKLGWFAIIKASANLNTKGYPATITPNSQAASLPVMRSISAINVSRSSEASGPARPFDKISYTISAQNIGATPVKVPIAVKLSDVLEYAQLVDDGGGSLNTDSGFMTWPATTIAPGATEKRTYVMQIASTIPSLPSGQSNGNSYDCIITSTYGTTSTIGVDCPPAKGVENIIADLPKTNIWVNLRFSGTLLLVTIYFYVRTRQLKKEIRLIRHSLNAGTI